MLFAFADVIKRRGIRAAAAISDIDIGHFAFVFAAL
jgi:hypothetical protein